MERRKKLRMGETLVTQGLITLDQLRIGLKEQKATGLPIGRQLVSLGFITEAVLRDSSPSPWQPGYRPQPGGGRRRGDAPGAGGFRPSPPSVADRPRCRAQRADARDHRHVQRRRARPVEGRARRPDRDRHPAGRRGAAARVHRQVLRLRSLARRHPARNRNRRSRLRQPQPRHRGIHPAGGAAGRRAADRRGEARIATSTSNPNTPSCASATASTACWSRSAACTRPTGRASWCA